MLKLISKTLFAALFTITSGAAFASHKYGVTVFFDPSDPGYSMNIYTPEGNPPNSKCMHVWETPSSTVTLRGMSLMWESTIEDKNSPGCVDDPKYNTWKFDVRNGSQVLSSGTFQFYHDKSGSWRTMIKTTGDVKYAWCSQEGKTGNDCKDKYYSGTTDNISIIVAH